MHLSVRLAGAVRRFFLGTLPLVFASPLLAQTGTVTGKVVDRSSSQPIADARVFVTGTALETSLRGTFGLRVRKGQRLRWPRAETPTHYVSMGLHEDLDEATRLATREMIDFLVSEKGLSRDEAYALSSLAANLHVTQFVDQTKGVHAMIAKSIFK